MKQRQLPRSNGLERFRFAMLHHSTISWSPTRNVTIDLNGYCFRIIDKGRSFPRREETMAIIGYGLIKIHDIQNVNDATRFPSCRNARHSCTDTQSLTKMCLHNCITPITARRKITDCHTVHFTSREPDRNRFILAYHHKFPLSFWLLSYLSFDSFSLVPQLKFYTASHYFRWEADSKEKEKKWGASSFTRQQPSQQLTFKSF